MDLQKVVSFLKLIDVFRKVERTVHNPNEDRMENDVEHSYGLAMLAWYIADSENLKLNRDLVVKYAMVHDLVEAYAGDTYIFGDKNHRNTKKEREEKAAQRIAEEFPEFSELHQLIHGYENRQDPESKFVYALDKVHAPLQIYLGGGRTWREMKVNIDMLVDNKTAKVAEFEEARILFERLIKELRAHEEELFGPENRLWSEK
jgi:putative hydrolases of HD superfamily